MRNTLLLHCVELLVINVLNLMVWEQERIHLVWGLFFLRIISNDREEELDYWTMLGMDSDTQRKRVSPSALVCQTWSDFWFYVVCFFPSYSFILYVARLCASFFFLYLGQPAPWVSRDGRRTIFRVWSDPSDWNTSVEFMLWQGINDCLKGEKALLKDWSLLMLALFNDLQ